MQKLVQIEKFCQVQTLCLSSGCLMTKKKSNNFEASWVPGNEIINCENKWNGKPAGKGLKRKDLGKNKVKENWKLGLYF